HSGASRGLGQGYGLHPLRRLHSHRRRLRPPSRPAQRDDGLRPPRRQHPRPQRKVQPEELRAGNRVADPIPGRGRRVKSLACAAEPAGSIPDATGFVLAGGRSARMGQDKALLQFAGQPLIAYALSILADAGLPASIAGADPESRAALSAYAPVIDDSQPGLGPLAGVCEALAATTARYAVFLSVDTPFVPPSLVAYLLHHARITGHAVTVPSVAGFAQTFPAV